MGRQKQTDARWVKPLLRWFSRHKRSMPWRRRSSPYFVWISEIMLQQTQVQTVSPYFNRFVKRFPSLRKLAGADLQDVLKAWEGLGYYSRARNLHKSAQLVLKSHNGKLPQSAAELHQLPGIGPYTAAAIASICFLESVPCVDGNVVRVLCRFLGLTADSTLPRTRQRIRSYLAGCIPASNPGDFNEAIMELGALVCRPKNPICRSCPLRSCCNALATNKTAVLPRRPKKPQLPHYDVAACVIWKRGRVLIAQRRPDQMLGSLWEFPGGKLQKGETVAEAACREIQEEIGIDIEVVRPICIIKHSYTHFKISLNVLLCRHIRGRAKRLQCDAVQWVLPSNLHNYPFPATDKQVVDRLRKVTSPDKL